MEWITGESCSLYNRIYSRQTFWTRFRVRVKVVLRRLRSVLEGFPRNSLMNVPRTYPGGETFCSLSPNLLGFSESIYIFCCSGPIDLKFGTMVEGMGTGHHAKLHDDRCTTKDAIPFCSLSPNLSYSRSIRSRRTKWNSFFRSNPINLKFGRVMGRHVFYHHANFQVNRPTTTEDTDGFGESEQIRRNRAKRQTV